MTGDTVREYRQGDEESIVALFNTVFGTRRTLDRWRWQYAGNPQGLGWIQLGESNGEVVGQVWIMRHHLNFRGEEVCAGQMCDGMVRSDQRGKKWFVRLGNASSEYAASRGLRAVFGFPNRNSYPGLARTLGWHRVATLRHFCFRTGFRRLWGPWVDVLFRGPLGVALALRAVMWRWLVGGADITASKELPAAIGDLLDESRNYEVLSVWKDLQYFRWRYEQHPDHRYLFHVLRVRGVLEGVAVSRQVGATTAICEFIHRTKEVNQAAVLLDSLLRYHLRRGTQRVEFFGHDDGFFESVFRRCGFTSSYATSFVFSGRVYGEGVLEQRFIVPQNWTVVYGDTDVI